ncbi:MAG TPA: hypothetical protein VKW76_02350 [Candidatus Binatia bacterium]|nr:hypothetical protein [Candidatus Binatia bacterium]
MRRRPLLLVAAFLLAAAGVAAGPVGGRPIRLRVTGRLAASRATAARTIAALALEIRGEAASRWLGVTDARTLPHADPIAGQNLVQALLPLGGRLRLSGPAALLARLQRAPIGSRITIEGMGFAGDPNLLVTRVNVAEPPSP